MLSPQALIKGLVSRALPSLNPDGFNSDVAFRQFPYGEMATQPLVRKSHNLADEGSYYVTNNVSTAVAPTYTGYLATTPFITLQNNNPPGGPRLYLDYIVLQAAVAGAFASAGVSTNIAVAIDNTLRYASGGTVITSNIANVNGAMSVNNSNIAVACGAVTASAASPAVRLPVSNRIIRPAVSATVIGVVGDSFFLNFGGVEQAMSASIVIANVSIIPMPLPPVVVPPGGTVLIYLFYNATTPSAATYLVEVGFWVR
jgi:hypothetical protein